MNVEWNVYINGHWKGTVIASNMDPSAEPHRRAPDVGSSGTPATSTQEAARRWLARIGCARINNVHVG